VLDRSTRRVRVGPGARWGDVAEVLSPYGLAISSGDYGGVGAGGLATTGGVGWLARKYGLTIDHVLAVEIVLADGTLVRADAEHHPDLFWAVRGAGGNFGVVTAFEIEASEVGDVAFATLSFDATDTTTLLERWGMAVEEAPRELTSSIMVAPPRRRQPPTAVVLAVYAGDDVEAAQSALAPLTDLAPLLEVQAHLVPYPMILRYSDEPHRGGALETSRSGLLDHITPEAAAAMADIIGTGDALTLMIRSAGGAVHDTPADATAYAHRTQNFSVLAATVAELTPRLNERWAKFLPLVKGSYLSFETDTGRERLHEAFPEPALTRLRTLKAKYDPDNLFNQNFPIPPAPPEGTPAA
jgi:FAD/FMN-containing dehydrogenase